MREPIAGRIGALLPERTPRRPDDATIRSFLSAPAADAGAPHAAPGGSPCPRISVVTPSFNQARFLERTIVSVINQGYPNTEHIVVDGGSTDGSVEVLRRYGHALARWTSEKDRGQTDALNKGLRAATGDIIGWQNSDDVYLPGAFLRAADAFARDPALDVFFGNTLHLDGDDAVIADMRFTPFRLFTNLYEGIALNNQGVFWGRRIMERAGLPDERYQFAMDFEYFIRMAARGARFRRTGAFLGGFRLQEGSKTSDGGNMAAWRREHEEIVRRYGMRPALRLPLRALSTARRVAWYLAQGDAGFLARAARKRIAAAAAGGRP